MGSMLIIIATVFHLFTNWGMLKHNYYFSNLVCKKSMWGLNLYCKSNVLCKTNMVSELKISKFVSLCDTRGVFSFYKQVLDDLMGMLTDAENQSRNSSQDLKHQRSSTNSGSFLSSQKSGAEIYKRRSSNSSNMLLKGSSECAVAIAPFNPVYCFFCTNGIERSTFAMAASALFMYNKSVSNFNRWIGKTGCSKHCSLKMKSYWGKLEDGENDFFTEIDNKNVIGNSTVHFLNSTTKKFSRL